VVLAYAWPDIRALRHLDTTVSTRLLVDAAVFVSPGYQFGLQGEGHFRLCYARDEVEWALALERVVDVLDKLGRDAGLAPRVSG
jgi:aspartate/methionine/tyrosine aminotransferase